jgi:Major Facilitator Superfamily
MGRRRHFHGWRVVAAAFVLAVFGWGLGFYGPPIYLEAICNTRGWPVAMVSAAVTLHYLIGAVTVAGLPALYRRFGVPATTRAGALALAGGVGGWAVSQAPWELFAASAVSGAGWGMTSAAAVNAIVSPWFVARRPAALSAAYNGSSIGGVIFSPLWVAVIAACGFPSAAAAIGAVTVVTLWVLAARYFGTSPERMGLLPDGGVGAPTRVSASWHFARPPAARLRHDLRFVSLAAGMALGLCAQIGLLAHLFSLLVPAFGTQQAGLVTGGATAAAILGRTIGGSLLGEGRDRRLFACASYALQIAGCLALIAAAGHNEPLLLAGVLMFGAGIGNATSLPPLIAQSEFARDEVGRVVPRVIAIAQACYAFAPATFGLIRQLTPNASGDGFAPGVYAAALRCEAAAIAALLIGRRQRTGRSLLTADAEGC